MRVQTLFCELRNLENVIIDLTTISFGKLTKMLLKLDNLQNILTFSLFSTSLK